MKAHQKFVDLEMRMVKKEAELRKAVKYIKRLREARRDLTVNLNETNGAKLHYMQIIERVLENEEKKSEDRVSVSELIRNAIAKQEAADKSLARQAEQTEKKNAPLTIQRGMS